MSKGARMNKEDASEMAEQKYTQDDLAQAWDAGRLHGATWPYGKRGLGTDDNPHRNK